VVSQGFLGLEKFEDSVNADFLQEAFPAYISPLLPLLKTLIHSSSPPLTHLSPH
jgi:hypothetical protein